MKQTLYRQPLASLPLEQASTTMTINNDCSWISTPNRLDTPSSKSCLKCDVTFNIVKRKHQCKNCMSKFCGNCSKQRLLRKEGKEMRARICNDCADNHFSSTIKSSGDKIVGDENDSKGANGGDSFTCNSENVENNNDDDAIDITFFRVGYTEHKAVTNTSSAVLSPPSAARTPLAIPANNGPFSTPSTGSIMFRDVLSDKKPSPNSTTAKIVMVSAAKSAKKVRVVPPSEIATSPSVRRISPTARKRTMAQTYARSMRIFICIVLIVVTSFAFGLMSLATHGGHMQHWYGTVKRAASKVVPKEYLVPEEAAPEQVAPEQSRGNVIIIKLTKHKSRFAQLLREMRHRAVQQLRRVPLKGEALKTWVRAFLKKHEVGKVRFHKI